MRVVGLTGGIGSGKSSVASIFRKLGAHVIDADQLAREVVAPGTPGLEAVHARFGPNFLTPDGALDRQKLGKLVFDDAAARQALVEITHPRIRALAKARIEEARTAGAEVVIYDVPLLYESHLEDDFETIIVVDASRATQKARLAARDGFDPEAIEARLAAQWPLSEKVARADIVVDNNGPEDATEDQVRAIWATLRGGSKEA